MTDMRQLICNLGDAVNEAERLQYHFFRGHSQCYGALLPGIHRSGAIGGLNSAAQLSRAQRNAAVQFRRKAGSVTDRPLPGNPMDLLILMQHHGVPTCLLDWSESLLVALFFAVSQNMGEDGELWAMDPASLNTASMGEPAELPLPSNKQLTYLALEGIGDDPYGILDRLKMSSSPIGPIAFEPPHTHKRMTAQLSTFTIHPNPILQIVQYGMPIGQQAGGTPRKPTNRKEITELLPDGKSLVQYKIPSEAKKRIREGLRSIGITHRTLFVDLDSLGMEIRMELARGFLVGPAADSPKDDENKPEPFEAVGKPEAKG